MTEPLPPSRAMSARERADRLRALSQRLQSTRAAPPAARPARDEGRAQRTGEASIERTAPPARPPADARATDRRERSRDLQSMPERVDAARARQVLNRVSDPAWWNRASAQGLETARSMADSAGTPAAARVAIHDRMEHVARTRYGTDVRGAIAYERANPMQPPPDVSARSQTGPGRSI